jgi:hypothetical protein
VLAYPRQHERPRYYFTESDTALGESRTVTFFAGDWKFNDNSGYRSTEIIQASATVARGYNLFT